MAEGHRICVGVIAGAQGIRGQVRLRSFTDDPEAIFDYKPLTDETGQRVFVIKAQGTVKEFFMISIAGVDDRNAAEALRGTKLFVDRATLPKTKKNQYYEADLIGLAVQDGQGKGHGKILGVHNYGAGPFLEIGTSKKDSFMLPFTDACVPKIDGTSGLVIINPPEGWLNNEKEEDGL